ncbi:IclR family transcriptional regulator [Pollutimonas subterranea]|uniref:IclR family transcriptional regulator n=2 Tax=Pollutimonas subterranea TaxID=2045210 RepID=A0A2N4U2Y2_9BURK|nr:IclR family transcriptional regulator [Pollutimonas subterranea]
MPARTASQSTVSGTQTIQRAALLLRLLTSHNRTGLRLVDLHQKAELERSTTHRILQGLIAEQLVSQHPSNKRYFLGNSIYEMGLAAAPPFNLRDICHPHIKALAQISGDTVFLVVRSGFDGVCVDRQEGSFPIRVFIMDVGRRRPLNVGGGNIAIMSTLTDAEIERICLVNRDRIAESYPNYSEKTLHERIAQARAKGYLVNNILEVPRARSIAVPVRTSFEGSATVALSISAVDDRMQPSRIEELSTLLLETAKKIEEETAALLR